MVDWEPVSSCDVILLAQPIAFFLLLKLKVNKLSEKKTQLPRAVSKFFLKGTVSRDFRSFLLKRFDLGPLFRETFSFSRRFSRKKSSKILGPHSQWLSGHANFSYLSLFRIFKLLLLGLYQVPFFHLIVPLKSVRSLNSFMKVSTHPSLVRFCEVVDYAGTVSAQSIITLTRDVPVVIDEADIMSE